MISFRKTPIKQKLTILFMLTSGVALLLTCVTFVAYDQATFRRTIVMEMSVLTDLYDDNVAPGLTFNEAKSIEQALKSLDGHPNILGAAVYDKAGRVVAKYQRSDLKAPFRFPAAQETGAHFKKDRIEAFRRILLDGETIGTIYIVSDLRALNALLWHYALIASVVLAAAALIAFALSSKLQRIISGPISHLAEVAGKVATGKDYSIRAVKQSEDELGQLIDGFNEMLNQIQRRDSDLETAREHLEKRVEERTGELADSLSLLNATLDSTADGILALQLSGSVVCYNNKFAVLWGFPSQVLGRRDSDEMLSFIASKLRNPEHFLQRITELSARPGGEAFDVLELKDGRTVERYIQPQRIGGQSVGLVINFRDVTERRRAEEALRTSELKFRQLAENIREVFWMTTPDMHEIIYVSPAYQEVWGRSLENLYKNPLEWTEAIVPEDRQRVFAVCHELASLRSSYDIEYRIQRPDGTIRWIRDRGVQVLDDHGQVYRTAGVASDITERKQAEASLEAVHKQLLETSRQAGMAEVATGVLHNVGNVLNSVNVSATLIADNMRKSKVTSLGKVVALFDEHAADLGAFITNDPAGQQVLAYLKKLAGHLSKEQQSAVAEVESLRKNIEHIKDIVAMQQSYAKVSGVAETVKVTDLVEDALRMNAGALTRHQIQVIRQFEEVPPVMVEKHKVLQILVNLIRNAKYACAESARKNKELRLCLTNGEGRVKIAVIDNGIGIPPENLTRIFNHGFTTRKDGHGFGLHSGALAAREMGGSLNVHSDGVDQGATFTLELPLNPGGRNVIPVAGMPQLAA